MPALEMPVRETHMREMHMREMPAREMHVHQDRRRAHWQRHKKGRPNLVARFRSCSASYAFLAAFFFLVVFLVFLVFFLAVLEVSELTFFFAVVSFFPKASLQLELNSALGPERTMGPDMFRLLPSSEIERVVN
ncbi:MAG: hypothetical protein ACI9HK_004015 [Pirellulaceae bacterium]|jgi:hypothetical protein